MEHNEIYLLMMEALDGELGEPERREMAAHLHHCTRCAREWQAIQAIHTLFQQTPALSPAAGFTQRTLARLPNRRYRLWAISAIYGLLLVSGLAPLLVVAWLISLLAPVLAQPAFVRSLVQAAGQVARIIQAILGAFWQGLGSLGELVGQQPAVLGWLLVMLGLVFLWSGVYGQLTGQVRVE